MSWLMANTVVEANHATKLLLRLYKLSLEGVFNNSSDHQQRCQARYQQTETEDSIVGTKHEASIKLRISETKRYARIDELRTKI